MVYELVAIFLDFDYTIIGAHLSPMIDVLPVLGNNCRWQLGKRAAAIERRVLNNTVSILKNTQANTPRHDRARSVLLEALTLPRSRWY
jgi:hypothetical protein